LNGLGYKIALKFSKIQVQISNIFVCFQAQNTEKMGIYWGGDGRPQVLFCFPNKSQPRSSTKIGLSLLSRHNGGSSGDAVMSSAVTRMLVSKLCSDRVNGISNRFGNAAKKITNGA